VERLELIQQWLSTHKAVTFKHIRRDGNKVVDILVNIGVNSGLTLHAGSFNTISTALQLKDYNDLVQIEMVQGEETHLIASDNHAINGD